MATDGAVNRWNGVAYAAVDERRLDSALLIPGNPAAPFSSRGGRRVNGSGLAVSVGGGPEAWTVTAGAGVIYDPTYASQGAWRFEIPTAITANMPARPAVGQSRIDLIVARLYDSDIPVGAVKEVKIERVNGTAGATPSAPATPALSLVLATLTVPNAGGITVTPTTAVFVAAGGVLPVATTAARDQLVTDGVAYNGLVVNNAQTNHLERYDGTTWIQLSDRVDTGWTDVTPASGVTLDGTRPARYRKIGSQVYLRGRISRNSGNWASGDDLFTLPAGFRPVIDSVIPVSSGAGAMQVNVFASTGLCEVAAGPAANSLVVLDNVRFLVD